MYVTTAAVCVTFMLFALSIHIKFTYLTSGFCAITFLIYSVKSVCDKLIFIQLWIKANIGSVWRCPIVTILSNPNPNSAVAPLFQISGQFSLMVKFPVAGSSLILGSQHLSEHGTITKGMEVNSTKLVSYDEQHFLHWTVVFQLYLHFTLL